MPDVTTLEIHPAIGIARVGNSQQYFFGPEPDVDADMTRRDGDLLKRQAARFRVYSCTRNSDGAIVAFEELTPDKATITWKVHLANRKAAAPRFLNGSGVNTDRTVRRNNATGNDADPVDRELIIDGGIKTLVGPSQAAVAVVGRFRGEDVPLGHVSTQDDGRLVVVGGFGVAKSRATSPGPPTNFADNDDWFDDTSDGPVSAMVHFADGRPDKAVEKPAWVIACQPDYAPDIQSMVTLYDALIDEAIKREERSLPTFQPVYHRDVSPLLERATQYQWANRYNRSRHGVDASFDFMSSAFDTLADPADADGREMRKAIFRLLRDPTAAPTTPQPAKAMPPLFSDDYFQGDAGMRRVQPLTQAQYRIFKEWSNDNFTPGDPEADPPSEPLPDEITRVALDACVGASFCPGIEVGRRIRDAIYMDDEPFRFCHTALAPGGLTESMALPWQADFYACKWEMLNGLPASRGRGWWPAQRPDHVLRHVDADSMDEWDEGAGSFQAMVDNWHTLGFVMKAKNAAEEVVFVETHRVTARPPLL